MKGLIFSFLSGVLFFACSNGENVKLIKNLVDIVEIPVPFDTNSKTVRSHLVELNNKTYLARENKYKKSIQLYNLTDKQLVKEVVLQEDGPNRVNFPYGFTYHNLDSIFVSAVPPEIVLVDSNGEVKKRKSIKSPGISLTSIHAFNSSPFQIINGKLYGAQPNFIGHHEITKQDFKRHFHVFRFDLESDTVDWFPVHFREDHWKHGKKRGGLSYVISGDSILIAPFHDHDLWIYDLNTGEHIDYKVAKSVHVNEFWHLDRLPSGNQEGNRLSLQHAQYENFLHDPYRKLYYRFYYLPYNFSEDEDLFDLNMDRPYIGVMVLDERLEVVGEYQFNKFEVEAGNYFVGKEGLYLSLNNLNHPDFTDNLIRYQVVNFALSK